MAENETGAAAATAPADEDFQYPIRVEDAGSATKKVHVEIPHDRIEAKLQEQFKELRQQAAIPGFRVGHAPQKLIEKRFSNDVKEQVRGALIRESYEQAVEKNNLQVIGEPVFDDAGGMQLPELGPLMYSFEVEVQPDITVPNLQGLKIRKPRIEVTEENVGQAMTNLREQQGALVPVEDRGVETKDYLIADVHVKVGGNVVGHQHDSQIVARPGRIAGVQIDDFDKQMKGLRPGQSRSVKVQVPEDHPNEVIKGKEVEIEFTLKDIKKLEPVEVNQEFLESLGFENEQELLEALREQMVERIDYDVRQAMREQINKYLIDNVQIDLPTKLSTRQEQRVVQRRAMDLMMRGVPKEQIAGNVERLSSGAKEEAVRELKLFFILQKVATDLDVDVDEAELNGRIAMLAAQRGVRPEKLKHEMAQDGTLANLYVQMREQKALDKILDTADIEEVDMAEEAAAEEEKKKQKEQETKAESKSEPEPTAATATAEAEPEPEKKKRAPRKKKAAGDSEKKAKDEKKE